MIESTSRTPSPGVRREDPPRLDVIEARSGATQLGITKRGEPIAIALSSTAASQLAAARRRGEEVVASKYSREIRDGMTYVIVEDVEPAPRSAAGEALLSKIGVRR